MERTYTLTLTENDLGQILDGLAVREESWQRTAEYLRSNDSSDDDFLIEECSDVAEADRLAGWYARIIAEIEQQQAAQRIKLQP